MKLAVRIFINAAALWAAAGLISGISLSEEIGSIIVVAAVFGIINAVLKPVAKLLTFPAIILSLGLFTLVINALLLQLTDSLTSALSVDGFGTAVLGAIVISVVSWALSMMLED